MHIGGRYHRIAQCNRIIVHIRSPEIGEPHDVIQLRDHKILGPIPSERLSQSPDLGDGGFSHVLFLQNKHRMAGKLRPVLPSFSRQILLSADLHAVYFQRLFETVSLLIADAPAIEAEHLPVLHRLFQILACVRYARLSHLHQRYTGVLHLPLCLNPVAAVGPEAGPVLRDDQRSRRTGESGIILSRGKIFGGVFRVVIIRRRNHQRIDAFLLHLLPELVQMISDLLTLLHAVFPLLSSSKLFLRNYSGLFLGTISFCLSCPLFLSIRLFRAPRLFSSASAHRPAAVLPSCMQDG